MAGIVEIAGSDTLAASRTTINDNFETLAGLCYGSTAPSPTYPYMFWADTNGQVLKQRNGADDAWLILGQLGQNYLGLLSLSGGTMSGDIDMDGNALTGLPEGVNATDAARVQELNLKADLDAPAFTGDATVNQDPAGNNSLIRRIWANSQYMARSGGTFTGEILGVTSADAAGFLPRSVIEGLTSFHTTTGHRHDGSDARRVRLSDVDGAPPGILYARVSSAGAIISGSGIASVTKSTTGRYDVVFTTPRAVAPVCIPVIEYTAAGSVTIGTPTTDGVTVYTFLQFTVGAEYYLWSGDAGFDLVVIG